MQWFNMHIGIDTSHSHVFYSKICSQSKYARLNRNRVDQERVQNSVNAGMITMTAIQNRMLNLRSHLVFECGGMGCCGPGKVLCSTKYS